MRDYTPRFKEITPKKKKVPYRYVKKATGEADIFREILSERSIGGKVYSEVSQELIENPNHFNCAHILSKAQNKYPLFKLRKDNIAILTEDEHFLLDHGDRAKLKADKRWDWLFKKAEELKQEYEQLKKDAA